MKRKRILLAAIALLLLVALLQLDGAVLLHSLRQLPLWLMVVLLALQVVTQLLVNLQWYGIAKLSRIPLSYRDALYANSLGAVVDSVAVKLGGEVTRAVQISRIGPCSGEQAAALVALQKLFSLSAMCGVLLFAVGHLPGLGAASLWVYGALTLFLLGCGSLFRMPHRLKAYLQAWAPGNAGLRRLRGFLLTALHPLESARQHKRAWALLALLSLCIWLLYPAKLYVLVLPFYPQAHVMTVAAATFAAYMVAMLPIFPGGLGGFEATLTGLLAAMGMALSDAVVVTVFFRFATFWFVLLLSLAYIGLRRALGRV